MDSSDGKSSIDKLNGTNYSTWKFQTKHFLLAKGLYEIVDGSEKEPASTAEGKVKEAYKERSRKAFSHIVLSVSTELLYLITDCNSAADAWNKLQSHFERNTLANKLFLKKQYFRSSMKEGTPIEQHMKHMKDLSDKLAAVGAAITEEDQVVTILGSLPESYANLVTALEARVDNLTLDFVHQSLKNEEQKRLVKSCDSKSTTQQPDAALLSNNTQNQSRKSRKPIICYSCNLPGHISRFCPDKAKGSVQQHQANHATSSQAETQNVTDDYAFIANGNSGLTGSASWIIDSGASRHMTPHQGWFVDYVTLSTPEKVGLGDGHAVDAIGVGSVRVMLNLGRKVSRVATIHDVLHVPDLAESLFSVKSATEKGKIVQFGNKRCWIKDATHKVRATGTLKNKL